MDERPNEIVSHIRSQREQLDQNLNELEDRVHAAADWRAHYERHPFWFLGAAAGAGFLLAGAMAGTRQANGTGNGGYATGPNNNAFWDRVDQIKGALVDFGTAKVKEALTDIVPGLGPHLK